MAILTPATLWPPLVKVCIAWLKEQLPDAAAVYDTSTVNVAGQALNLSQAVAQTSGVIQVIRTPGGGYGSELENYGNVDLYFYGKDAGDVESLAQRGHSAIVQLRAAAGWRVDEVRCEASPGMVPYSDPTVQRWVGSYLIISMPQQ